MVNDQVKAAAIIPARGGSKSIPRKNIKLLGGTPLIAYSVAAAQDAEMIDRVIVSTDDEEIAQISRRYGAEIPFQRPDELAEDTTRDLTVFQHALGWLAEHEDYRPKIVIQLRPTSPFRPAGCIDEAVKLLLSNPEADSVRAVTPSGQNPYKMWRIVYGALRPLLLIDQPEPYNAPRQELPPTYWQTGHLDVVRAEVILQKNSMSGDTILPFPMDSEFVVDLDTEEHWQYAEYLLKRRIPRIVKPVDKAAVPFAGIRLVVSDFDGVMTDDTVCLSQDGAESVVCSRKDGMGLSLLREAGIPFVVLSSEVNPVVAQRCRKLQLPFHQGVSEKAQALDKIAAEHGVDLSSVVYLGNDINDLGALRQAGIAVAPSDARPEVLSKVDVVLKNRGGHGAVRELCDLILNAKGG